MAALKHSDRVISINLTFTSSLLEKLSSIKEPFSELEELFLLSVNTQGLAFPGALRWGSRLRRLHLTRIASPALPRLLPPSLDLVDLQLHEIPSDGYFPPNEFANALSGMTQLRSLLLHFHSFSSRRNRIGIPPPSGERVDLPALTRLKFRGPSKYLDSVVARIDAPRLGDIEIRFFNQLTFDVSQLGRFVDRIEIQKSYHRADVLTSKRVVSISFTQPGVPTRFGLEISCGQSDWQLLCMAQICNHLPASLLGVGDVGVNTTRPSSGQDDVDREQWLEVIRPFRSANRFYVAGKLAADIVHALRAADGEPVTVLPALQHFYVQVPVPLHVPLREIMASFITWRKLRGCPVRVKYRCSMCTTSFSRQQELRRHIKDKHEYQPRRRDPFPSGHTGTGVPPSSAELRRGGASQFSGPMNASLEAISFPDFAWLRTMLTSDFSSERGDR